MRENAIGDLIAVLIDEPLPLCGTPSLFLSPPDIVEYNNATNDSSYNKNADQKRI
jgi:hypothetical protein